MTTTTTTSTTPPTAPTVAAVVERVLTQFDANDDDRITLDEVLALLDPDGTRTTLDEQAKVAFATVDGDGSGAIDSAELTAAVSALDADGNGSIERGEKADDASGIGLLLHGHGPHGHGGGFGGPGDGGGIAGGVAVTALVEHTLARFDADDSGTVSLAELVAEFGEHGRTAAQAEADAATVLALVDGNADQSISAEELTAAATKADSDADGLVEWAEFVALPADYALLMGVPHGPHGDASA